LVINQIGLGSISWKLLIRHPIGNTSLAPVLSVSIAYEDYLGDTLLYVCNKWSIMENINWNLYCILPGKSQIILKMRTADVCHTCMRKIIERDISQPIPWIFLDVLDGIRLSKWLLESFSCTLNQPSRMEIRGTYEKIFLRFRWTWIAATKKALYLLFKPSWRTFI
jgi:hypothetical protein